MGFYQKRAVVATRMSAASTRCCLMFVIFVSAGLSTYVHVVVGLDCNDSDCVLFRL
jgi:hypothetical protein